MFPKIGIPKMDGLFHGKPYEQMDDLGGKPILLETPIWNSDCKIDYVALSELQPGFRVTR